MVRGSRIFKHEDEKWIFHDLRRGQLPCPIGAILYVSRTKLYVSLCLGANSCQIQRGAKLRMIMTIYFYLSKQQFFFLQIDKILQFQALVRLYIRFLIFNVILLIFVWIRVSYELAIFQNHSDLIEGLRQKWT